jgi:hypothetical protein
MVFVASLRGSWTPYGPSQPVQAMLPKPVARPSLVPVGRIAGVDVFIECAGGRARVVVEIKQRANAATGGMRSASASNRALRFHESGRFTTAVNNGS